MTAMDIDPSEQQASARVSSQALRGRCVVRFDSAPEALGGIAASLLDDLSEGSNHHTSDIFLTADSQRVTYGVTTDRAISVVFRGREGMLVCDHGTRTFARIPADGIPGTSISPASSLETRMHENGEEVTFTLVADDPGLGRIRHEITLSRREDWAPFGPALMRVLHCGSLCHARSGLPWAQIANAGLIVREKTFRDGIEAPISELDFESLEIVAVGEGDFEPPEGYQPLEELLRRNGEQPPIPSPSEGDPSPMQIQAAVVKQAIESDSSCRPRALRISETLTPDCLGSTRFGSVTASLHQDFLTAASNAVNSIAPLLGPTTIAGGTWTVPWLANLAAVTAASPTAPGSGIFCLLRQPRISTSPPGPTGGGTGLLDLFAFRSLYALDAAGTMRTQREFAAGTLAATLATWGVGPPANANLLAASGNLTMISLSDQRVITEAYETTELGVLSVTGLRSTMDPFSFGSMTIGPVTTPPLFTIGLSGVAGTVNFASLGAGPLVTAATIGSSGNFVLGLRLPTTLLTATVSRSQTLFGFTVLLLGTVGICVAMPLLCGLATVLVVLSLYVLNNITSVAAAITGVTWTMDVRFEFDPNTERVEPFVSLLGRTGTVTVASLPPSPNIIGHFVDVLIAAFGNLFDIWGGVAAIEGAKAIQGALRDNGLQLPVAHRQNELRAIDGDAQSTAGNILLLTADVRPIDSAASQPFTSQVAPRATMRQQLLVSHLNIRRDLNPQPTPPPPGPGPALSAGTFAGLGLSQNTLNYYVFQQWVTGRYEVTITDPVIINRAVGAAPQLFNRIPVRIHIWPATSPRIEIAPREIALQSRPLVVYFDDVRACFEVPNARGRDGQPPIIGLWELSFNFKTSGTIELAWPWVFSLRVDASRTTSGAYEPRTWEFVDPNIPAIMGTVAPSDLAKLVDLLAAMVIGSLSAVGVQAPPAVRPWTRPLPAMQQEIFPALQPPAPFERQQAYLEVLARRKGLYILPVIDTALLELVDGSGAPILNTIILPLAGAPGPFPTNLRIMTCPQGTALRSYLFPLLGIPAGP